MIFHVSWARWWLSNHVKSLMIILQGRISSCYVYDSFDTFPRIVFDKTQEWCDEYLASFLDSRKINCFSQRKSCEKNRLYVYRNWIIQKLRLHWRYELKNVSNLQNQIEAVEYFKRSVLWIRQLTDCQSFTLSRWISSETITCMKHALFSYMCYHVFIELSSSSILNGYKSARRSSLFQAILSNPGKAVEFLK